ncbi:hypothetical protein V6N11_064465 [Hibiscus sabdariffa]|uniref:Protein-serine/threonine phosphatase n=1 Tax=Hibiscus sabdariffa TaxID=183260 RepID=A0ABR2P9D8_9ROSI
MRREIARPTAFLAEVVVGQRKVLEDQSQIESGQYGTFVGIYDGHGGPETARYVCDHLFKHFRGFVFMQL